MEKKIKVTTPMCMNPKVMSKGHCEHCDARCPYFVTYGALLWTLEDWAGVSKDYEVKTFYAMCEEV